MIPDLSIVIVSWNVRELLAKCLDAIQVSSRASKLAIEVIVVDSGSMDGSAGLIAAEYAWVRLFAQPDNIGFSAANNLGLSAATGRHIMLLNPDTEVIDDALAQMVAYLDAHPDVGIVGPQTLNTDGTLQSTKRRFPTLVTALFESTWLQPLAPRPIRKRLERFYTADIPADATADVDWMQGSALMICRAAYTQIGGLDDRYVMYSEEIDWCKRVKNAGWRVVYVGSARIIHHGGKSSEQVTARRHIHFQQSKLYYFRKHHGASTAALLRAFLLISYGQQLFMEAIKAALGHKRALRRERVHVYRQVIRALVSG